MSVPPAGTPQRCLPLLLLVAFAAVACGQQGTAPTEAPFVGSGTVGPAERGAPPGVRYDGQLTSVNVGASSFTLGDGTTVGTNDSTRWKSGGPRLTTIQQLADAVADGLAVRVKGKASGTPLVAEDVDARVAQNGLAQFSDIVDAADATAGTLTLAGGTTVNVLASTTWRTGPNRLPDLAAVVEALDAGIGVQINGRGPAQSDGSINATRIDVRVRRASLSKFRGEVATADAPAGTITLIDGTVLTEYAGTEWKDSGKHLGSLGEVEAALGGGATVKVGGRGVPQDDGSVVISRIRARSR